MDYLKDKQFYIDSYDLGTIRECLDMLDLSKNTYVKMKKEAKAKNYSKGETAKASNWMTNQLLFQIKAQRYGQKESTIQEWMDKDEKRQSKLDTTIAPENIRCLQCNNIMNTSFKQLDIITDSIKVMFLFSCESCKKKRWIYEDGTEWESKPNLCPKCNAEVNMNTIKESENKIIWKTVCPSCGFTETTEDDFEKSRIEWKKREEHEKKLLEVYRQEFASDEKGKEAFEYVESLKVAKEVYEEEVKKHDSVAYQKAIHLKKINIPDLEILLNELFKKNKYIKFSFDKPEMGQYVIITFSAQDAESSRNKNESVFSLTKLIQNVLAETNWRLMTDGISYRLGYISGRLRAYENEEDLYKLSGGEKKEKSSKLDPEFRMKYESSNVVQLARVSGEYQGIENARMRRLEKEPSGFFLEISEGPLECSICGERHSGNEIWWNLDGQRCIDCWKNIKAGVIPSLPPSYKSDGIYFQNWQIDSNYGVKSSTVRMLKKQNILKGRELKRTDGTIYCTIYIESENKEFLKQYPMKEKNKWIVTDILGEKVEL
jgi:hypothetical protein